MKSRLIILGLCVGALAYACGPRSRNDASAAGAGDSHGATAAAVAVLQQGAPRAKTAPISGALRVRSEAAAIHLSLHVVNNGRKSIELVFPTGQTHDFAIIDSIGREVWRWGSSRMFTQALRNRLLARGESLDLRESWNAPSLAPGRYTAVGTLRSANYPVIERAEFAVGAASIAARE